MINRMLRTPLFLISILLAILIAQNINAYTEYQSTISHLKPFFTIKNLAILNA